MLIRRSILSYLILSSVFLVWHPDHFLKDVLVAPLFVLVPIGLGLSITRLCLGALFEQRAVTRLSALLLALFVGLAGHTIVYQQLERLDVLREVYPVLYPLAVCIALFSFYREKELFRIRSWNPAWFTHLAIVTPLVVLAYSFYFLKFSQYPLRDIFQETHFMKGAMELARFHTLNPFTADSYIPVLQVHLGLLHDWYGYDLLASQWILPVVFAVVRSLTLVCLFEVLSQSSLTRLIAIALAIVTLQNLFSLTNGGMAFSVCLLLISIMLSERAFSPTSRKIYVASGSLFVAAALLYKISTVQSIGLYWVIFVVALVVYRGIAKQGPTASAVIILLCVTVVSLHPAMALLYLFCALGVVCLYSAIMSGWEDQPASVRQGVVLGLFMLTVAMGSVLGILSQNLFSRDFSQPLFHGAAEWILGKEITGGEGMRNTIIEWVRLAPPALILLLGLLVVAQVSHAFRALRNRRTDRFSTLKMRLSQMSATTVFAWSSCLVGLFISFSGLPYVHRALYFPLLMSCLLIGILLSNEITRYWIDGKKGFLLMYPLVMLFYIAVVGRYGYKAPDLGDHTPIPYVQALSPYLFVALLGLLSLFLVACVAKIPWRVTVLSLSIVFIGVLSDKFAIKSYGYRYSYGDAWWKSRPISHYTVEEVRLASRIRHYPMDTILLSDPYTLSIVEALTGVNGLYSFSNLGVMRPDYKSTIQNILSCFKKSAKEGQCGEGESVAQRVMNFIDLYPGAVPEARYVLEKKLVKSFSDRMLHENLVIILNAGRTFLWTDGRDTYFSKPEKFDDDFIEFQIANRFKIIENIDNTLLVLRCK